MKIIINFFVLFFISSITFSQGYQTIWTKSTKGILVGTANCDSDPNLELLYFYDVYNAWKDYFIIMDGATGVIEYNSGAGTY